jgi:hypothetical protein
MRTSQPYGETTVVMFSVTDDIEMLRKAFPVESQKVCGSIYARLFKPRTFVIVLFRGVCNNLEVLENVRGNGNGAFEATDFLPPFHLYGSKNL